MIVYMSCYDNYTMSNVTQYKLSALFGRRESFFVIHDKGHIVFVLSDKELNFLDEENNDLIESICGKNRFVPFHSIHY